MGALTALEIADLAVVQVEKDINYPEKGIKIRYVKACYSRVACKGKKYKKVILKGI